MGLRLDQGGHLMHVVAAKAVAFKEAQQPEFKTYAAQIVKNAKALADALTAKGYRLVSGGTDNHLMLVDLRARSSDLTGIEVAQALEKAGIICNYNGVPNDPRPPRVTSGIRLGTPALTTRGLKENDLRSVADFIDRAITAKDDPATLDRIRGEVKEFATRFPMPH
jgi:glycine hydroxymethyltransferase